MSSGAAMGGLPSAVPRITMALAILLAFKTLPLPGICSVLLLVPAAVIGVHAARIHLDYLPILPLAILGLLVLSVLWSDVPDHSVTMLRTYGCLLLAGIAASSVMTARETWTVLRVTFAVLLAISIFIILSEPPSTWLEGRARGLHAQFNKNTYGQLLAMTALVHLGARSGWSRLVSLVAVVLMALTLSVTSWAACVLTIVPFAIGSALRRSRRPMGTGIIVGASALGAVCVTALAVTFSGPLLSLVARDNSLTDRTAIWAATWPELLARPLLGHGAFAFLDPRSSSPVTQEVLTQFAGYRPPHPHSGVIDMAGQLGLVGLSLYAALVITAFRGCLRALHRGDRAAGQCLLAIAMICIFGLSEPTFLGPWLVVMIALARVAAPPLTLSKSRPLPAARIHHVEAH